MTRIGASSQLARGSAPSISPEQWALDEVVDALGQLGVEAKVRDGSLVVDGRRISLTVSQRAHPTPAELASLVREPGVQPPGMVVADRISDAGRNILRDAGWGWLDRRGHLRLWAPGVRVESALPSALVERARPANPWTTVGFEVALAALIDPTARVTARRVATLIGRSVGATQEMIQRFTQAGLIGPTTGRPLLPDLFWETAAHWPDDGWVPLPVGPAEVGIRVGPDAFVRVDERAATLGGAKIAAAGDLAARGYVTSAASFRRLRSLIDRERPVRCWVRAAPLRWLPDNSDYPPDAEHPWRIAHPLICALRLGADPARGRELVDAWGIVPEAS
ncbi:MAG: hypothetical protein N2037_04770 [Acidimicrobiales bacterium]|nr:hypothetical protein [Acidimicrobiales bacterium]